VPDGTPDAVVVGWDVRARAATEFFEENGFWPTEDFFDNPRNFIPHGDLSVSPDPIPAPADGSAPAPGGGATVDWDTLAALVQQNFAKTGVWGLPAGGPPSDPTPPVPGTPAPVVDWNAAAAAVTANFQSTGTWF
jgi:hypothetical protein